MTVLIESRGVYLKQLGKGPALGIVQMEPATHDDCWRNFLDYKPNLASKVQSLEIPGLYGTGIGSAEEMAGNLYYAVAMCRIKYFRDRQPLPAADDIDGLAQYHKRVYNSHLGASDPKETAKIYREHH